MEAREGVAQAIRRVSAGVRGVANGDTEDVVQEALARAIKSGVSLEAEQWLRTVAKRVAIDQHRRRRETPSGAPTDLEKWVPSSYGNPEESYLRAERATAVREALAALPSRYRGALLAYAEEDSPAAVAKRLGLSAAATWTLLSRARSRLRLQLEQVGFVPALIANHPRVRGWLVAGAAAGVAATVAVAPSRPVAPPVQQTEPKVAQFEIAEDRVGTAPVEADGEPPVPAVPGDVVGEVEKVVGEVPEASTTVGVSACLLNAETSLTLGVTVDEDAPKVLRKLIERVPERLAEPLTIPEEPTC